MGNIPVFAAGIHSGCKALAFPWVERIIVAVAEAAEIPSFAVAFDPGNLSLGAEWR